MEIKCYESLPQAGADIRRAVFMEEQGFQHEFDDADALARHLVLYQGGRPAGTCRLLPLNGTRTYLVGRIAVLPPFRGQGLGAALLRAAEQDGAAHGGTAIVLHAQVQAQPCYEKQGYRPRGEVELVESCPHIWMEKQLGGALL